MRASSLSASGANSGGAGVIIGVIIAGGVITAGGAPVYIEIRVSSLEATDKSPSTIASTSRQGRSLGVDGFGGGCILCSTN